MKQSILAPAAMAVLVMLAFVPVSAQRASRQSVSRPVMWTAVNIPARNLYYGPGGTAMRPETRRIRFIRKETGGNNLKYRISDARGRVWVAKIADESQAEVAANRLLWVIGYRTEIDYLAPRLSIPGQGTLRNVRLEARPAGVNRDGRWQWDENPFAGTREGHRRISRRRGRGIQTPTTAEHRAALRRSRTLRMP